MVRLSKRKTTRMLLLQRRWPLASRLQKEIRKKENGQRNNRTEKGNVYNRSFADIVKTNANRTREAITVETPKIGKNNYKQTNRERSQKQDEIDRDRRNDEKRGPTVREESTSRDGGVRRTRKDRDTPDIENETEAKRKKEEKTAPEPEENSPNNLIIDTSRESDSEREEESQDKLSNPEDETTIELSNKETNQVRT